MPAQTRRPTKERGIRVVHEAHEMRQSSSSVTNFNKNGRFKEQPPRHTKRVTFSKPAQPPIKDSEMQCGLTSCLITSSTAEQRQFGGANNPNERKVSNLARTDSECRYNAPGIDFLTFHDTSVTTHEIKMNPSAPVIKNMKTKCDYFPKFVDPRPFKDQTTQTLYRESSAQTVAYLPDVMDKEVVDGLELFNLSGLLPGDKPPGLYEVEVLERARKRWAFNEALKINFSRKMQDAREEAKNSKYRSIFEAFEWQHWIEREEYIQECQMMRLEIVIRMFDKREKEMHEASKTRIEMACERIEKKRRIGLQKNEIEYQRGMRRLEAKLTKTSRKWHKQNPTYALGSPCSEFYGPLIRHGVDPARRHFVGIGQKTFDMRIDELENRVDMTKLQCPFTKLREWSKPKEYVKEYEQNFCSDNNLQKLYESLKGLRTQATKSKTIPKCLKHRPQPVEKRSSIMRLTYEYENQLIEKPVHQQSQTEIRENAVDKKCDYLQHMRDQKRFIDPEMASKLLAERRQEALENVLNQYEGSFIGWIMQFLSEEMDRLKEQRKLHFFSILAQKERWRREAAEAGLRQKENDMRMLYEEIYQQTNQVHSDVTKEYVNNILSTDMSHIANCEADETVTTMAKQIDHDIKRWLESFKLIQTPLNYVSLREMLRDMVAPDVNALVEHHEKSLMAKYIIEDVLMARVWLELEPYDIVTTLVSDLIDRLIDNDLYMFSSDSEPEDGKPAPTSWLESRAIIRKLIRQAVSGQRWKDETERICHEIYNDLFSDIFLDILFKIHNPPVVPPSDLMMVHSIYSQSLFRDTDNLRVMQTEHKQISEMEGSSLTDTEVIRVQMLNLLKKLKKDKITRNLETLDHYHGDDQHDEATDYLIHTETYKAADLYRTVDNDEMFSILSTLDIGKEPNLTSLKHAHVEKAESSSLSDIPINFGPKVQKTPKEPTVEASDDLITSILKNIIHSSDEQEIDEEDVPQKNKDETTTSTSETNDLEDDNLMAQHQLKDFKVKHLSDLGTSIEAQLTSRLSPRPTHQVSSHTLGFKDDLRSDSIMTINSVAELHKKAIEEFVKESVLDESFRDSHIKSDFNLRQSDKNKSVQPKSSKQKTGKRNASKDNIELTSPSGRVKHPSKESSQVINKGRISGSLNTSNSGRSTLLTNQSDKSHFSLLEPATDVPANPLSQPSLAYFSAKLSGTKSQKTSEYNAVVLQTPVEEEDEISRKDHVKDHSKTPKKISNESQRE
ncbi:uncharacterized protein [Drosophila tropicalis]|uniref:uncharacterized protein n=1 Tax=Drosophila tropicalis TaxID=46794 RepID=UPI0035ABD6E6